MELDEIKEKQRNQYVCTVCGFNMVGYHPNYCPFCGAHQRNFLTSEECSAKYKVKGTPVNDKVTSLRSAPSLGLEHSAYRIETNGRAYWIDCPSCFDGRLEPVESLMFTHHHFLGASNLYRDLFPARVKIHELDSIHQISKAFSFDELFTENFSINGIEAFHIAGHTPGFTFYIFEDALFVCDYVFLKGDHARLNPFGPPVDTKQGFNSIMEIIKDTEIRTVCGYNYVADFEFWKKRADLIP